MHEYLHTVTQCHEFDTVHLKLFCIIIVEICSLFSYIQLYNIS